MEVAPLPGYNGDKPYPTFTLSGVWLNVPGRAGVIPSPNIASIYHISAEKVMVKTDHKSRRPDVGILLLK